jgi:hypothetical protein
VIAIAIIFVFGLATTVFLSLRSPEVKVPDVIGKDRFDAERVLGNAGLNFRVRASRPSNEVSANTVLFQLPHGGEVVKAGQTVAMDISRGVKEGESSEAVVPEKSPEEKPANTNDNNANNDNKPKRNKNTNKNPNANDNSNGNRNANANANRLPNANKITNNGSANRLPNANSNRPPLVINNNSTRGVNANTRPPRPAPTINPN